MKLRVRWVGIALLALLTVASVCLAAEPATPEKPPDVNLGPDTTAAKPDTTRPAAAPAAAAPAPAPRPAAPERLGDFHGYGGIGGGFGGGRIVAAGDYSEFVQTRMSFSGCWRYTFADNWRWQLSPGFTWGSYNKRSNPAPFQDPNHPSDPTKDNYLTLLVPISFEVQWLHRSHSRTWHVGAGPGLYRVWVENYRKVVPDPITFDHHRGLYWGGSAELGFEQFWKSLKTTSLEVLLDGHIVQAKRDDQFPSGFNDLVSAVGLRVGVNYYFNLRNKPKPQEPALPGMEPPK